MSAARQHHVVGVMARDAVARPCAGGAYVVDVEITVACPKGCKRVVGCCQHGHGADAEAAAHTAADQLRRGTPVEAWCAGIGIGYTTDDIPAIALRGVDQITPLQPASPAPAAHQEQTA